MGLESLSYEIGRHVHRVQQDHLFGVDDGRGVVDVVVHPELAALLISPLVKDAHARIDGAEDGVVVGVEHDDPADLVA